jgi:Nif-specific regulatory protein
VGDTPKMLALHTTIRQIAPSDATVLIRGEPGTGKGLVAAAIHLASQRAHAPFTEVSCSTLGEELLDRLLFGGEDVAFGDAPDDLHQCVRTTSGGTLFLDEIDALPAGLQVKLLRLLQHHEFPQLGNRETSRADVRVIAATCLDIEAAIERGDFRRDLYYRINVLPVVVPPLRERREDIVRLAYYYLEQFSRKLGKLVTQISPAALGVMQAYEWPGNVRELVSCLHYAVLLSSNSVIGEADLPPTLRQFLNYWKEESDSLETAIEKVQRRMISAALARSDGNVVAAARGLGISSRKLRYTMKKLAFASHKKQ